MLCRHEMSDLLIKVLFVKASARTAVEHDLFISDPSFSSNLSTVGSQTKFGFRRQTFFLLSESKTFLFDKAHS